MPTDFLLTIDPKDGLPKSKKSLCFHGHGFISDTEQPDAAFLCFEYLTPLYKFRFIEIQINITQNTSQIYRLWVLL